MEANHIFNMCEREDSRMIIGHAPKENEKFTPISHQEFLDIFVSKCLQGIDGRAGLAQNTKLLYCSVTGDHELYCQF